MGTTATASRVFAWPKQKQCGDHVNITNTLPEPLQSLGAHKVTNSVLKRAITRNQTGHLTVYFTESTSV